MSDWFNFLFYAIQRFVATLGALDLGVGFSLLDIDVALLVIGVVGSALVIRATASAFHVSGSAGTYANFKRQKEKYYGRGK